MNNNLKCACAWCLLMFGATELCHSSSHHELADKAPITWPEHDHRDMPEPPPVSPFNQEISGMPPSGGYLPYRW